MIGEDPEAEWKRMKREVGESHEKHVGRCFTKVFHTAEGYKPFDGVVKFVHWIKGHGILVRAEYDDGDKEDISVEELESLLRVVRVGCSLKDEGTVFHVEEQPYGFEW